MVNLVVIVVFLAGAFIWLKSKDGSSTTIQDVARQFESVLQPAPVQTAKADLNCLVAICKQLDAQRDQELIVFLLRRVLPLLVAEDPQVKEMLRSLGADNEPIKG